MYHIDLLSVTVSLSAEISICQVDSAGGRKLEPGARAGLLSISISHF